MKVFSRFLCACALLVGLWPGGVAAGADGLLNADHVLAGKIWDMKERRMLSEAELRERIAGADLLLLGETHDNPRHHEQQLRLLQDRLAASARPALLFEQFDRDRQSELDAALEMTPPAAALEQASALAKGWDWKFYEPLLETALAHRLPVFAANFSRAAVRPVIRNGFSEYSKEELERLAVERVWDERRQQFLTRTIENSHCGQINTTMRDGLVRGQRLRDAVMADVAAAASSQGRGVVGIVGRGHARRDIGIPLYLQARYPDVKIFSLGFVEVGEGKDAPDAYEQASATGEAAYDAVWFTERVDRPDPCASFGKR